VSGDAAAPLWSGEERLGWAWLLENPGRRGGLSPPRISDRPPPHHHHHRMREEVVRPGSSHSSVQSWDLTARPLLILSPASAWPLQLTSYGLLLPRGFGQGSLGHHA
jgi:hypothetical protein